MWKEFSRKNQKRCYTEMTIRDYAQIIHEMAPIRIFYNDMLLWDDNTDPLEWYWEILSKNNILVTKITCEVRDFHHSDVYIYTR